MAGDPLMVEDLITKIIDPDNDITLPDLRNAAFVAVMCVYERRVTTEFFSDVLEIFMQLIQQEAVMSCGAKLYEVLKELDPDREPEKLKAGMEESVGEVQSLRAKMLKKLKLVSECPTSSDKIS